MLSFLLHMVRLCPNMCIGIRVKQRLRLQWKQILLRFVRLLPSVFWSHYLWLDRAHFTAQVERFF